MDSTMSALNRMSQSLKNPAKAKKLKHKKLDEDWFDNQEPIKDGMMFSAKYLGLTIVTEPKGEDVSSVAVQRIINTAKGKKRPVQLLVSPNGIKIYDLTSLQLINDVSISRISFCAALKQHLKIFAFVAQNAENEMMECHAYLCNTVKEAQSLTVTVAQSFKIAFEMSTEESTADDNTDNSNVENEEPDSDLRVISNGEKNGKKTAQLIIPNVMEKRYQRLSSGSNPFDTSEHEVPEVHTPEGKKILKREEKQGETNRIEDVENNVFIFSSSPNSKTSQPLTPKSNQPITPIRPPPANTRQTDKQSTRRSVPRPTSFGSLPNYTILHQSVTTPSPNKSTPDIEDWDQGFADLALSRTQDEQRSVSELKSPKQEPTDQLSSSFPASNPFFSPFNPFN
ncbi:uncharacterized protein LOC120337250 [Styela clava]